MVPYELTLTVLAAVFGLIFGSFAGAQVWRIRVRQLRDDVAAGCKVTRRELASVKALSVPSLRHDRSVCLSCGHVLAWYDLLPLVSWLSTRGRCRYCKRRIGWFEPAIELAVAVVFSASYLFWPFSLDGGGVLLLIIWLASVVVGAIMFVYDSKWYLLPDVTTYLYSGLGAVYAIGAICYGYTSILSLFTALGLMAGLYGVLYAYSAWRNGADRTWVGLGDVKLSVGLALFLSQWQLAIVALFLANLFGTILVAPGLISGRLDRKSHVPFGPLLLSGTVVAVIFGQRIIDWYLHLTLV
ncbi:hypothetical protein CR983_00515 [Candidatus Saccharibacteria bacterium]|nr:MAG: hypothetical protein CR983_00515 [Candidatus Saccharibacteria bacterium]